MEAFISYSHQDSPMLDLLHKHLAQLRRDSLLSAWTDREIAAGGNLNDNISQALAKSQLFIALLSPDYIASNYCYETEFETALSMEKKGEIVIIPIIIEPCDWLDTPFNAFKALPKDGKAVVSWENKNTAFLDVIQNLRKIAVGESNRNQSEMNTLNSTPQLSRNYRIKQDFDSIQKLEFVEQTFKDLKEFLKRYIQEIEQLDNIKTRVLESTDKVFDCLLVNRNKIDTESQLKLSISSESPKSAMFLSGLSAGELKYSISRTKNRGSSDKAFMLEFDGYHLFWTASDYYSNSRNKVELGSKEISDLIWNEWLESVGIM